MSIFINHKKLVMHLFTYVPLFDEKMWPGRRPGHEA
jgi:hypothetical protein